MRVSSLVDTSCGFGCEGRYWCAFKDECTHCRREVLDKSKSSCGIVRFGQADADGVKLGVEGFDCIERLELEGEKFHSGASDIVSVCKCICNISLKLSVSSSDGGWIHGTEPLKVPGKSSIRQKLDDVGDATGVGVDLRSINKGRIDLLHIVDDILSSPSEGQS